jgi:hypothetical protein
MELRGQREAGTNRLAIVQQLEFYAFFSWFRGSSGLEPRFRFLHATSTCQDWGFNILVFGQDWSRPILAGSILAEMQRSGLVGQD